MEIIPAKKAHILGILDLQTQVYRSKSMAPNAERRLEDLVNDPNCDVLVAIDKEKVVATGMIFYIHVPIRGRSFAFIEGLVVDETTRGQGVGTQMLSEFVNLARKRDCYKIIFTSGFDREEAHQLYEKLGFKKWGYEFRMDL
jgi:GNAT superfamily N-acetyltransferase